MLRAARAEERRSRPRFSSSYYSTCHDYYVTPSTTPRLAVARAAAMPNARRRRFSTDAAFQRSYCRHVRSYHYITHDVDGLIRDGDNRHGGDIDERTRIR